jgi:hypothetical protein
MEPIDYIDSASHSRATVSSDLDGDDLVRVQNEKEGGESQIDIPSSSKDVSIGSIHPIEKNRLPDGSYTRNTLERTEPPLSRAQL